MNSLGMKVPEILIHVKIHIGKIKVQMELLQSQAPAERELFGSSVVRTLEFGNGTFDLRIRTLDIRVWIWEPLYSLL